MEETKRQKQVAGLIQQEMNDIFRRLNLGMIDGGMISISSVKITPDLLEARIYLSFFQVKDAEESMKKIEDRAWEVKKELFLLLYLELVLQTHHYRRNFLFFSIKLAVFC